MRPALEPATLFGYPSMHVSPALLPASALLLSGCSGLERLEVQGFRRSVRVSQQVPLHVAILIPEALQHLTVPSGSSRLNDVAIGEGLFDASIDYFGQVFEKPPLVLAFHEVTRNGN
jgi:hypothetical protein